jgi:hypothetical protein
MIDIIGAIALGALLATVPVVLTELASITRRTRLMLLAGAAISSIAIVGVAAAGGFLQKATGPVPGVVIPFALILVAGVVAWIQSPRFREIVFRIPLSALIAINAARVLGVFFVILYSVGRLPAPFAQSAGFGDILVGVLAVPLAIAASSAAVPESVIAAWNALGIADLVIAVSLALMSAAGTPFRVFTAGPDSGATLGALPWAVIPTLLVPLYLLIHFGIAVRLRAARAARSASSRSALGAATI